MTTHNTCLLDLYTDYLLASFGAATATGLARLLPEISHDQVTRFLSQRELTDKDLGKIVKPHVRRVQSKEAVLILDDSVEEIPYTDQSELICWHFDHTKNRTRKGINLLSALYLSQDTSLPVAFALIKKTERVTDKKTGKDKWQSPKTKNEFARDRIASVVHKQIPFRYVLADVWFPSAENMVFIKNKASKDFILPLKSDRRVAVSEEAKKHGQWAPLSSLRLGTDAPLRLHLQSVPFCGAGVPSGLHKRRRRRKHLASGLAEGAHPLGMAAHLRLVDPRRAPGPRHGPAGGGRNGAPVVVLSVLSNVSKPAHDRCR
jgi:hypothetical protein